MKFLSALLSVAILGTGFGLAAEFHVSPSGAPDGDGSASKAWDLRTAFAHPDTVEPGDTIWLHGGDYRGGFESALTGEAGKPIIVRQAPGERARIIFEPNEGEPPGLYLRGEHARYQGFEVLCEGPVRETKITGSWPADIRRGGVEIRGSHIEAVNLVVHDLSNGFGFWREGEGGEIYGCLIYNNGWTGPDRGHGHGIYSQNERGVKSISECLIFRQFGGGIHVYGSGNSALRGYRLKGVAAFDTGRPDGGNLLVGGGAPLDDIEIAECFTRGKGGGMQVGYSPDADNKSVIVRDNYLVGGLRIQYPGQYRIEGNTVIATSSLISMQLLPKHDLSVIKFDRNTFHKTEKEWSAFSVLAPEGNRNGDFTVFEGVGFGANSTYSAAAPAENRVFVRPNRHEPGRGHVLVYNWEKAASVEVGLGEMLKSGQKYRIVHAQDFFGESVVEGIFDSKPVAIPMTPRKAVSPIGLESTTETTDLDFGALVVLPNGG